MGIKRYEILKSIKNIFYFFTISFCSFIFTLYGRLFEFNFESNSFPVFPIGYGII